MEFIKSLLMGIRFIGLRGVLRTLTATMRQEWYEYIYKTKSIKRSTSSGKLLSIETTSNGLSASYEHAHLEIAVLETDLVRVTWTPGQLPVPYAIVKDDWALVDITILNENDRSIVTTNELCIHFYHDGRLDFFNDATDPLSSQLPPVRAGSGWHQLCISHDDEHIFGLGERASSLNLRGGSFRLWNRDPGGSYGPGTDPLYLTIPVFYGLHDFGSYLIFYENSFDGTISFHDKDNPLPIENTFGEHLSIENRQNTIHTHFTDGAFRYYLISGPIPKAIERYTQLTGRHSLPPQWSLGLHQSRWGYKNESDIRAVASGYQEHNLPISAIHLDIDYMDGYRIFTVDENRFPNLSQLSADLESMGIHVVTIIDPGVKHDPEYSVYRSGSEAGAFCKLPNGKEYRGLVWPGWCVFPDFTNPDAREWWQKLYGSLFKAGVDGIWHDMNEPTSFVSWGDSTFPGPVRHHMEGQSADHTAAHNLYALQMNRAGFEAYRQHLPTRRPWILSRSGWAGLQRYAWSWTGDTESTWPALRMTLPMTINLGLSGIGFTGPDIGGFSGAPDDELYIRWLQLSTFLPFYRIHSAVGTPRREPWMFDESVLVVLRKFINLRYQLIPYLYTLAWRCSQNGHPLIRPIFWLDEREKRYWHIDDSFLLGDDLLVAPILEKMPTNRKIFIPAGDWYDFWSDRIYHGPSEIEFASDIGHIPLFVRAGCILPMHEGDQMVYHVYPPTRGEGHSELYMDIGDGYGPSRIETFQLRRLNNEISIDRRSRGDFIPRYTDTVLHIHGHLIDEIELDGISCQHDGSRASAGNFNHAIIQLFANN